ncbi:MAG: hypothetical protein H7144_12570 [Burkholderiales bacterium]|nr:hypothetical protein [Phycisphaerae bacterium]
MRLKLMMPSLLLLCASFCALLAPARNSLAQNSSALINEALDKLVELDVDTPLPQALQSIESKTGVPVRASRAVYDTLPWGEQTKLTAKISGKTLRDSLSAITLKLGLRFVVTEQTVDIEPLAPLVRIGRRSTVEELGAIDWLASTPFKTTRPEMSLTDMVASIDQSMAGAKSTLVLENRADLGVGAASPMVKVFKNQTLYDVLEEVHKQTRATWYPWGKSIVIVPKEDHVRTLLNKQVTIRFAGVDVAQVLTELARRSGVEFTVEPGAVQRIPPESRVIKLILENVTTRQALESISGFTGLGYVANENGVYIWNPSASPVSRRADRTVTIITVDGIQVLIPESEIPPDVSQYLKSKREKGIESIREQMKKEGYKPTTQPGGDL